MQRLGRASAHPSGHTGGRGGAAHPLMNTHPSQQSVGMETPVLPNPSGTVGMAAPAPSAAAPGEAERKRSRSRCPETTSGAEPVQRCRARSAVPESHPGLPPGLPVPPAARSPLHPRAALGSSSYCTLFGKSLSMAMWEKYLEKDVVLPKTPPCKSPIQVHALQLPKVFSFKVITSRTGALSPP